MCPSEVILEPLLFLICINDLSQSLSENGSYLCADDTCVFYQDKDVYKIKDVLNKEFAALYEWFIDEKSSVYFGEDKTNSLSFLKLNVRQS